ncbi:MAG: phospholipase D-like domain-containing protein [Myxococcales bacterium]
MSGNQVTLLHDGAQALPAMLEAIGDADREILLEMYWFGSDRTGRQFADALMAKAREGVRVRVIYDAVGSIETDPRMFDDMRNAGCQVEEFNPIAPWRARFRVGLVNHRDHRKLLVVDRQVGFTGGVNLGDEWAPAEADGGGWRDDTIRIDGPAVEQMRQIFEHGWHLLVEPPSMTAPDLGLASDSTKAGGSRVLVIANHYLGERRAIRHVYLQHIERARRAVCITNSYFVPDGSIQRALARAVARGVEVKVIVPGTSDVTAVWHAARKLYGRLLEAGIQLFEWQGSMLHAKTAVIDGRWCTIGTYNLDSRSLRFNLEVVATVEDSAVARAMEQRFDEDLADTKQVSLDEWRDRPLHARMLDDFFYRFHKLL